jgi:DNA-binding transcriptional ArsR family regulator
MLNFDRRFFIRILAAILKMAEILEILKRRIAPLMVTYHYVKFYVSIIIHLEVLSMLNFCRIVVAILKMATGRNFSMSGINLGHHYLPTYQILMISDNVEFLPPIFMPCFGSHFEHFNNAELLF